MESAYAVKTPESPILRPSNNVSKRPSCDDQPVQQITKVRRVRRSRPRTIQLPCNLLTNNFLYLLLLRGAEFLQRLRLLLPHLLKCVLHREIPISRKNFRSVSVSRSRVRLRHGAHISSFLFRVDLPHLEQMGIPLGVV